jgi:hypothetical protein|tara:strand:+ start:6205 stop:6333 length:129 start_codon:yes stop_codon:yes gene_type:complete
LAILTLIWQVSIDATVIDNTSIDAKSTTKKAIRLGKHGVSVA